MRYFTINMTEDGETYITAHTKAQLEECLDRKHWGETNYLSSVPETSYHTVGVMIIKGEIVVPVPVRVVEKLELP